MLIDQLRSGNVIALVYMLPILVVTLTVHELCHGLAAYALGDTTAKTQGRLSLNPLKHIDLMGFATLLLFGFGWAKPVGVDLRNLKKPKRDFALVAVAGPFSNFFLALLCVIIACFLGVEFDGIRFSYPQHLAEMAVYALIYAIQINLGLGVFNMLPIPPLDGSRLLASFLPDKIYVKYLQAGRYGMFVVLALIAFGSLNGFLGSIINMIFKAMFDAADGPVRFISGLFSR